MEREAKEKRNIGELREGLREKEKHCLSVVLKQVAQMKDNTYHLVRHMWNDVQEDWPFYTEQERQSLKRRKPQNLTPSGSSDGGSSGSGQSPTSTHPGCPPSTISTYSAKRPGHMEGADGLPTKYQRISHYRKPAEIASVTGYRLDPNQQQQQQQQRSAAVDSSSRANDMLSYRRQERQESPHHNSGREFAGGGRNINQSNWDSGRCTGIQENEENVGGSAQDSYESAVSSGKYRSAHSETLSSKNGGDNSVSVSSVPSEGPALGWNNKADSSGGVLSTSTSRRGHGGHHDNRNSRWNTNNGGAISSIQSNTSHHNSPDSQVENVDTSAGVPKDSSIPSAGQGDSEYPDYLIRKPQNLTPSGSSDGGSSGSGQSPTSTHPGCPPSTISTYSAKRPGYMEGADGLPTKYQRISHYRKPAEIASVTGYRLDSNQQQQQQQQRSAAVDSSSRANDMLSYRRQERQESPHHNSGREFAGGGRNINQSNGDSGRCTGIQENEENVGGSAQDSYESAVSSGKYRSAHSETLSSKNGGDNSVSVSSVPSEGPALGWNNKADSSGGVLSTSTSRRGHGGHHDNRNSRWNTNNGGAISSIQSNTSHHNSPDSQVENVDTSAGVPKDSSIPSAGQGDSEYPDYLMSYITIRNFEQRERYKADFNADYSEYRDLCAVVEKVSRRFAQLEERLKQHEENTPAYKSVKQQIVLEYKENKRDLKYQEEKKRFRYLHMKLAHIKRLVLEYDSQVDDDHVERRKRRNLGV